MVNWQAELIDSPELSPDTPASDRSVGVPAAALREPMLVPQGGSDYQVTVAEPEHLRAEGQAPALLGRDSGSAFRLRGARFPCRARTRPTSRLAEKYPPVRGEASAWRRSRQRHCRSGCSERRVIPSERSIGFPASGPLAAVLRS